MECELLPCEALEIGLEELIREGFNQSLSLHVRREMNQRVTRNEETQRAEELLRFAQSKRDEKLVRIVSADVPSNILPADCKARLLDIQTSRRGPDDKIYNRHPDIRNMIPRGITILEWEDSSSSWSTVVVYGHKKFTGGVGDEDEVQPENNEKWREYFVADPSKATSVICMEKLNGEAAHISSRYIDDQFYLIVGSKNVHMIIRDISDIDKYEGSRYEYAKVIGKTIIETLNSMERYKRQLVLSFLHHTRCTLVGEILQLKNQHIVSLEHLSKPKVVIVSMTSTYSDRSQVDSLVAVPPHHFLPICSALGLNIPSYTVIPAAEVMKQKELVRRRTEYEGEVFYYMDENEDTIGLVKVKAVWYIILRALREKAVHTFNASKKQSGWNLSDNISRMRRRLEEIQKWLKFSDAYLQSWKNLGMSFLQWLNDEINKGKVSPGQIRPTFPLIWDRFLRTTQQSDKIQLEFQYQS